MTNRTPELLAKIQVFYDAGNTLKDVDEKFTFAARRWAERNGLKRRKSSESLRLTSRRRRPIPKEIVCDWCGSSVVPKCKRRKSLKFCNQSCAAHYQFSDPDVRKQLSETLSKLTLKERNELAEKIKNFAGGQLTHREIAKECGVSTQTVKKYCREYGIKTAVSILKNANGIEFRAAGQKRRIKAFCKKHGDVDFVRKGIGKFRCKFCDFQENHSRRWVNKLTLIKEKGGKCFRCGEENPVVLQFHHRSRLEKNFEIGQFIGESISKSRKEADKCDLVCANCHRIIEYEYTRDVARSRFLTEIVNGVSVESHIPAIEELDNYIRSRSLNHIKSETPNLDAMQVGTLPTAPCLPA